MRWPWSTSGRSDRQRQEADEAIDEVRTEVRSLASELSRVLDRIDKIEEQVGVNEQ